VRALAVKRLARTLPDDPSVKTAVIARLDDQNSDVRLAAVRALSSLAATDEQVRSALTTRLSDETSAVRAAAVTALSGLVEESVDSDESSINSGATVSSPPGSDEYPPDQATRAVAEPVELDHESLFRRLNSSTRKVLYHAAGMRVYFTNSLAQNLGGISDDERDALRGTSTPLPLEYLVAGLFENESGPTRSLFRSKDIDDAKLAALLKEAANLPKPSRTEYSPLTLTFLPDLQPHATRAFQAARDIADEKAAAQIQSRHLLYGVLSVKDNPLVKLLADAGVSQADVPLTEGDTVPVPKTIAFVSADTSAGQDLLGFEADVNALSAIIAAKTIDPPLSIGLFGDWGSGKSFFMGKMDECIRSLTEIDRATKGNSAYCSNIVQIWFNAWSYVESDLWASLVTDIFEELARAIEKDPALFGDDSPATAKARLLAAMASARDVVAEEERRRDAAQDELRAVEEHIANLNLTDEQIQNKLGSKELLKDAYRAVVKDPSVKKQIDDAAKQLSIPEAQSAAGEMRASLLEIEGIWSALGFALKGWKSTRAWLYAAAVLIGIVILLFGIVPLALKFHIDSRIAGAAAAVLTALTWLAPFLKKASYGLEIIKNLKQQQQQRIDDERIKLERASKAQQEAVKRKREDAETRYENAKAELGRLEQTLKEMRADKQLLNFIRERSLSTDYTSRLGTVARARRDFKQLSDLMDRVRSEKQDGSTVLTNEQTPPLVLPRIDRIVLYIDDLDRCAEDRVVKVLEAVHLLLAFRLFVVIVAVDSRWLLRSLRQHSSAFQISNDGGTGISDEELAHWESTPLNYLEKIFQIPFYLRPMRQTGFARLVDSVVGKVATEPVSVSHHVPAPSGVKTLDSPRLAIADQKAVANIANAEHLVPEVEAVALKPPGIAADARSAITNAPDASSGSPAVTNTETSSTQDSHPQASSPLAEDINPAALQLREWERDFMKELHPLVTSPRSTKRFVNIYRLMRVSITDQKELTAFVGDKNGGEHRAALLLLAILTGYPAEATDILRDLLERERTETWWQYIDGLEETWNKTEKPSTGSGSLSSQRRKDLMAKLRLLRKMIPERQSSDQFAKWASKVAKYSFESGRVLMLLNDEIERD